MGVTLVSVISGLPEGTAISLFITNLNQERPEIDGVYFTDEHLPASLNGHPFNRLAGSISGEWIAFESTYKIPENNNSELYYADIYIMDMTGKIVPISEGITGVLSHSLQYVWVQSR